MWKHSLKVSLIYNFLKMDYSDLILGLAEVTSFVTSVLFYQKNRRELIKCKSQIKFAKDAQVLSPWEIAEILKLNFKKVK